MHHTTLITSLLSRVTKFVVPQRTQPSIAGPGCTYLNTVDQCDRMV